MKRTKNDTPRRIHPFTAAVFLYRNAFLLLIPLVQYLLFMPETLWDMIRSGSSSIITAALVVTYIILKYRSTYLYADGAEIIYSRGIYFKRTSAIPLRSLNGAAVRRGIPRIFGAELLTLDAAGAKCAASEYVGVKSEIADILEAEAGLIKKCGLPHSLIAAADATSALSGLLLAIPFINRAAVIVGDALSDGFYGGIDLWTSLASRLLPPAVAYITAFLAAGYFIAFIYELLKHINGEIRLGGDVIQIKRGFIWSFRLSLRSGEISACTSEQGILCMILGIKKLFLLSGTGRKAKSKRELLSACRGEVSAPNAEGCIRPGRLSVFSFILLPLTLFSASVFAAFYCRFNNIYIPLAILQCMAIPLFLIWIMFRITAYERTYLLVSEGAVSLGSYRGLRIISAEIPIDGITRAEVRQNPFQRITGSCTVKIHLRNMSKAFTVKRVKLKGGLRPL